MHQVEVLEDGRVNMKAYAKDRDGVIHNFTVIFKDMESYKSIMHVYESKNANK